MEQNKKIICIILLLGILLYGYYYLYQKWQIAIPCPFYKITHLYCPGCGITRMLFALFRLEIYQAFRYNPFVFCLLCGYGLFLIGKKIILQIKPYELRINIKIENVLLIITILYGIFRNIPLFDFLAPIVI